jgi:hypothetical protein
VFLIIRAAPGSVNHGVTFTGAREYNMRSARRSGVTAGDVAGFGTSIAAFRYNDGDGIEAGFRDAAGLLDMPAQGREM